MKLLKNITLAISLCTIFLLNAKQMGRNVTAAPVNYPQPQPTTQPIVTPQNAAQGTYKWFLDKIKSMPDNQVFKSNNFLTDHALALVENIDHSALAEDQKIALKDALLYLHLSWTDNFENDRKRLRLIKEDTANRLEPEPEQPVIKKEPIQIPKPKPVKPVQPQPTQQSREAQLKKTQPETTIEIQPQTTIEEEEITNFIRGLLLQKDYPLRMAFGIEDKTMPYKFGNVERVLSDIISVIKQKYPQNMNMAQRILHENIFKNFRNKLLPSQEDEIHQYITNNLKATGKGNTAIPSTWVHESKIQSSTNPNVKTLSQQTQQLTQYIQNLVNNSQDGQNFKTALANKNYSEASDYSGDIAATIKIQLTHYPLLDANTAYQILKNTINIYLLNVPWGEQQKIDNIIQEELGLTSSPNIDFSNL